MKYAVRKRAQEQNRCTDKSAIRENANFLLHGDGDPLNKISGTTGISGAMDAIFVLDKSKRNADTATLVCTGRDIEYREMEMKLSKENCVWTLV